MAPLIQKSLMHCIHDIHHYMHSLGIEPMLLGFLYCYTELQELWYP